MDSNSEKVLERAKSEVDTTFTQEQVAEMLLVRIEQNPIVFEEGEFSEDELEAVA